MPVVETAPPVTARPWAPAAALSSSHVAPPWAVTVARSGSTAMSRMSARLIISPPSVTARPATLCPPPRTETSSPASRAKASAATTSAAVRARTITAGRRSTRPLWTARASS